MLSPTLFTEILMVLICIIPLAAAAWEDRDGDHHPNNDLVFIVIAIVMCSVGVELLHPYKNFIQAFVLSGALYVCLFPYIINVVHYRRGVIKNHRWWNHLSKTAIPDKWAMWNGIPWYARMIVLAIILGASIKVYVCWGKLFSYFNAC